MENELAQAEIDRRILELMQKKGLDYDAAQNQVHHELLSHSLQSQGVTGDSQDGE